MVADELILMRHAEAEPAGLDAEDFTRPLTLAGRRAAAQAAARLSAEGIRIGRVLWSPAHRTAETAAIVARELGLQAAALHEAPELYLATPTRIRAAIAAHQGVNASLLVVGHNPGLSELGGELDHRRVGQHLPTAGYWRISAAGTDR